jgi:hypothetical protein
MIIIEPHTCTAQLQFHAFAKKNLTAHTHAQTANFPGGRGAKLIFLGKNREQFLCAHPTFLLRLVIIRQKMIHISQVARANK